MSGVDGRYGNEKHYKYLERLARKNPSLCGVLNLEGAANLTVCPECRIDDFIHSEDCVLGRKKVGK